MTLRTDRAGFTRRWGVHVAWVRGAPWFSLGLHLDWHTPTLDLFFARGTVQIGRNNHDFEGRLSLDVVQDSGHTDQCLCEPLPLAGLRSERAEEKEEGTEVTTTSKTEERLAERVPVEAITGTLLHRAWLKSGRRDPLLDDDAWDGFALTIQALARMEGLVRE